MFDRPRASVHRSSAVRMVRRDMPFSLPLYFLKSCIFGANTWRIVSSTGQFGGTGQRQPLHMVVFGRKKYATVCYRLFFFFAQAAQLCLPCIQGSLYAMSCGHGVLYVCVCVYVLSLGCWYLCACVRTCVGWDGRQLCRLLCLAPPPPSSPPDPL